MQTTMTKPHKQDLPPVPYFYRSGYLSGDFQEGTLMLEGGTRMVVLPEDLIQGLHAALKYETGRAWRIVAYECGRSWGGRFLQSIQQEWRTYYGMRFDDCEYYIFENWLSEYFEFLGWGKLEVDFSREEEGMVQFYLGDSILDELLGDFDAVYVNEIFAGLLASLATWLSGRELGCLEIESPQQEAERSRLICGLPDRIERARRARVHDVNSEQLIKAFLADQQKQQ